MLQRIETRLRCHPACPRVCFISPKERYAKTEEVQEKLLPGELGVSPRSIILPPRVGDQGVEEHPGTNLVI